MDSRILVVDDEREIVELVSALLEGEGCAVIPCYDGDEALRQIEQASFDLAVLDVMLPGHDGFELCRAIRKRSVCPIIMLTARDTEVDKVMGLSLGADDYVSKPFLPPWSSSPGSRRSSGATGTTAASGVTRRRRTSGASAASSSTAVGACAP